jgi:hypothetical protein
LRVIGSGDADIHTLTGQPRMDLFGGAAGHREGDDPAPSSTLIVETDGANVAERFTKVVGQLVDTGLDVVEAPGKGVVNGGPEADLGGVVRFPVLEPSGVRADLVPVRCGPGCRM